jgi:hypothetical protein
MDTDFRAGCGHEIYLCTLSGEKRGKICVSIGINLRLRRAKPPSRGKGEKPGVFGHRFSPITGIGDSFVTALCVNLNKKLTVYGRHSQSLGFS